MIELYIQLAQFMLRSQPLAYGKANRIAYTIAINR